MDNITQVNGQVQDGQVQDGQVQETKKSEKKAKAPTEKMVRIRLPITREEKEPVPVWVNERSWLIQRGQEVEVPEYVAEVLRNKELMLEYGIQYDEDHEAREAR